MRSTAARTSRSTSSAPAEAAPNTAYSDIVLHEYGHALDDEQGGIIDGGYSEGFGDALALLATRQACVGRDFFGAGSCLRDASDVVTWPPASSQVHQVGRIYASFVQELVEQLSRNLSEDEAFAVATDLVLAADAGNPADIPDAVRLMFLADDDDGNPATCSPHFVELTSAATARRIPRPPGGNAPGTLEVRMTVVPPDSGRFNVRLDGGSFLARVGAPPLAFPAPEPGAVSEGARHLPCARRRPWPRECAQRNLSEAAKTKTWMEGSDQQASDRSAGGATGMERVSR